MSRFLRFVLSATLILLPSLALAQTKINLEVQYPLGFIFDKVFAELKTAFEKANPATTVPYRPAYKEYEDAAQTALRQAITKQLPDVALQAINMEAANYVVFESSASAAVVLNSYIGGVKLFLGPALGAAVMNFFGSAVGDLTRSWLL